MIPRIPPARGFEGSGETELRPRYEDLTQDGRFQLMSLMPGLGMLWRSLAESERLAAFRAQGVLPILRRIVVVRERGPFSVHVPLHCTGTWRLAREEGGDRLLLNMWLDASAPIATTFGPPPNADAERVLVGRVFAEHVITRPFAPAAERKVTRLDVPGIPPIPEDVHSIEPAEALIAGRSLVPAGEYRFGMMHTDSNQHVNSLVYPRLFEEAVVRTLGGDEPTLFSRSVDIRYRKPFFAGDVAALALHRVSGSAEESAHALHALHVIGAFAPASLASAKPSCTIAMHLQAGDRSC